jgi:hypothetical protein
MRIWILLVVASLMSACISLLPTQQEKTLQPWTTFEAAKASYDKIEPFSTSLDTVRSLGFDPFKTPNMKILNHAQVVQAVLPQPIPDASLIPPGILDCIKAREGCQGYFMEPNRLNKKRVGNFMLDFMNFRRDTITTGWKFGALIVIVSDKVVYKQWSGSPNIQEETLQRNPLGPLQGVGSSPSIYR